MSDQQPIGAEDAAAPTRTVEDALRELRALLRIRRARERAARQARFVGMLQAQSARRRAPESAPDGGGDTEAEAARTP